MPIPFQTPTGTVYMEFDEWLRYSDDDLRTLYATNEIDPLTVKAPSSGRDVTDEFDLPDISKIEEVDLSPTGKRN